MIFFKKLYFCNTTTSLLLLLILFSCATKRDPITGEKKRLEPSAVKRAEAARDSGSGILGGRKSANNSRLLGNSNIMWNAALKTLENIPLAQTDYTGGIIITDWYGSGVKDGKSEEIKITVKFVSNELSPASFNIISYKKTCIQLSCGTEKLNDSFSNKIKGKIINEIKKQKIETETKK